MFKKLVSNLPFSPSLVAQLGFYAQRLKKEQVMRRLGIIFTVFALIIQSFAIFSPPESANAASANDMIPGGANSVSQILGLWDSNNYNFRDVMSYFGITRAELSSCTVDNSWTQKYADWPYSFGRTWQGFSGEKEYNIPKTGGGTVYMTSEPLWAWGGGNNWFVGISCHSSEAGEFYIMKNCGNLNLKKPPKPHVCKYDNSLPVGDPKCLPPTAGCQSLDITVHSGPADGIAGQTEYRIGPYGWKQNGGTISDYYIEWSGPESGKTGWIKMSDWWYHKFTKAGTYKITAYVRGSSGTVTSAACTKSLTIKDAPAPKYDLIKSVDVKTVKPGGTINYTLTFKNLGNVALTNVIIKDTLPKNVTLTSTTPTITPTVTFSGNLFGVAGLKINSVAIGQTITIKYSVKVDSSDKLTCGKSQLVNQSSVKTDQKPDNGNNDETDPNNNNQTVSVETVCDFQYDLRKTSDKTTVQPGGTVKYTLTFRNTGNRELTDVVIKDKLPTGVTLNGQVTTNPASGVSGDLFSNNGLKIARVAAGQDVVITYNVKVVDKSSFQCGVNKLPNKASATTKELKTEPDETNNEWVIDVERACNCSDPEAANNPECQTKKTAVNNTQNGVDATSVKANSGDIITYTITVTNTHETEATITIQDALTDTLEYADLTDQGGGVFNEATKTLSWQVTLGPGETAVRNFAVTVKNPIPSKAQGQSYPLSYNCIMTNSYGTTIDVPVNCPPEKIVEIVVKELPKTGPAENIMFGGIVLAIVVFFYARSKQLGKEVRLVRREFNTGTL